MQNRVNTKTRARCSKGSWSHSLRWLGRFCFLALTVWSAHAQDIAKKPQLRAYYVEFCNQRDHVKDASTADGKSSDYIPFLNYLKDQLATTDDLKKAGELALLIRGYIHGEIVDFDKSRTLDQDAEKEVYTTWATVTRFFTLSPYGTDRYRKDTLEYASKVKGTLYGERLAMVSDAVWAALWIPHITSENLVQELMFRDLLDDFTALSSSKEAIALRDEYKKVHKAKEVPPTYFALESSYVLKARADLQPKIERSRAKVDEFMIFADLYHLVSSVITDPLQIEASQMAILPPYNAEQPLINVVGDGDCGFYASGNANLKFNEGEMIYDAKFLPSIYRALWDDDLMVILLWNSGLEKQWPEIQQLHNLESFGDDISTHPARVEIQAARQAKFDYDKARYKAVSWAEPDMAVFNGDTANGIVEKALEEHPLYATQKNALKIFNANKALYDRLQEWEENMRDIYAELEKVSLKDAEIDQILGPVEGQEDVYQRKAAEYAKYYNQYVKLAPQVPEDLGEETYKKAHEEWQAFQESIEEQCTPQYKAWQADARKMREIKKYRLHGYKELAKTLSFDQKLRIIIDAINQIDTIYCQEKFNRLETSPGDPTDITQNPATLVDSLVAYLNNVDLTVFGPYGNAHSIFPGRQKIAIQSDGTHYQFYRLPETSPIALANALRGGDRGGKNGRAKGALDYSGVKDPGRKPDGWDMLLTVEDHAENPYPFIGTETKEMLRSWTSAYVQ